MLHMICIFFSWNATKSNILKCPHFQNQMEKIGHFRKNEHKKVRHFEQNTWSILKREKHRNWIHMYVRFWGISGKNSYAISCKIYPPHTLWGISRNHPYLPLNFRVKLSSLADELNIEFKEVETLLITCILDGQIQGKINQVRKGTHRKKQNDGESSRPISVERAFFGL